MTDLGARRRRLLESAVPVAGVLAAVISVTAGVGCGKKARSGEDAGVASAGSGARGDAAVVAALASEFDKKCLGGDLDACRSLGVMYSEGTGVTADPRRAAALFEQACTGGNLAGCNHLAFALGEGLGVAKDLAQAAAVYGTACAGGHALACRNLGLVLRDGRGVARDLPRAAELLDKACTANAPFACTNAGNLDAELAGHEPTPAKRVERTRQMIDHFTRGCNAGDPTACRQIGVLYLDGFGVPKSAVAAGVWLTRGCDGDDAVACRVLGVLVRDGVGVARDLDRATQLFDRACKRRDDEACKLAAPAPAPRDAGVTRDRPSAEGRNAGSQRRE